MRRPTRRQKQLISQQDEPAALPSDCPNEPAALSPGHSFDSSPVRQRVSLNPFSSLPLAELVARENPKTLVPGKQTNARCARC